MRISRVPPALRSLPPRRARAALLTVILAVLSLLKVLHHPLPGDYGADGSTYVHIARHVAEGRGLRTSVSLYHQGLKNMPAPTTIYPLWPLLLGAVGRVIGLDRAAHLLPELLYLLALLALYALANRLMVAWSRDRDPRIVPGAPLDLGHVAVLLLGLNAVFFRYSSLPYTDTLALALGLAALVALARQLDSGGVRRAALAGALGGAAYLARTQMIVVPLVTVGTLSVVALRGDGRERRALAAGVVATGAVVAPWFVFLAGFVHDPHPMMLLDVLTYHRETPEVPPLAWIAPPASSGALARQVLAGTVVAFSPRGPSWVASFGPAAWTVPLAAAAVACCRPLRTTFLASRQRAAIIAIAIAGLGLGLMTLGAHSESDFAQGWAFAQRYGLPFIVLLTAALACLLGTTRPPLDADLPGARESRGLVVLRVVTLLLVGASLAQTAWHTPEMVAERGRGPSRNERKLAHWLDAQPRTPVVIARRAARLAVVSRASFHWIACNDPADVLRALFRHAGAEYLVTRPPDRDCRFFADVAPELELVETFDAGGAVLTLYRWRGAGGGDEERAPEGGR
ncbi:hypothetical protein K2Z84_13250 [Candidatus Binatia bacterium]|nr:hypothetical protein [Candidatus Binatia bacterium]